MAEYKVVEIFESINGEGIRAGQLAVFVRFQGCNLKCSYCDTTWANEAEAPFQWMTEKEIVEQIQKSGIQNVTLTGGEPLLQKNIDVLLERLSEIPDLNVEIETNGSISIEPFLKISNGPSFTMDYKLPGSGMEKYMKLENMKWLRKQDTVKFVSGSCQDLDCAREVIERYDLSKKCHVYLSPVFGKIALEEMVEYMKRYSMNRVNLQIQMHKVIWDPEKRGV